MLTLRDYFPEFLDGLAGQSQMNRRNYQLRLEGWLALHGQRTIGEITRADVNRYLQTLRGKGYAEATRAGFQQALKKFLGDAARAAGIRSPADHIRVERTMSREAKHPPEADVQACLEVAWTWVWEPVDGQEASSDERRRLLDAAVYLLSLETGARRGELIALRRTAMERALRNPDHNEVYRVTSYGKRGEVDLEFTDVAAVALRQWLLHRPPCPMDRLFTLPVRSKTPDDPTLRYRPLSPRSSLRCFHRICKAAGVPPHTSHPLRHRLGTLITEQHSPKLAAIKLNHADAETTAATATTYYYHPRRSEASRITVILKPQVEVPVDAELTALFTAERDRN